MIMREVSVRHNPSSEDREKKKVKTRVKLKMNSKVGVRVSRMDGGDGRGMAPEV
jgi:hypothetical protein